MRNLHQLVLLNNNIIASYGYYHFRFCKYFYRLMFFGLHKNPVVWIIMALTIQGTRLKGKKPEVLTWMITAL